MGVGAATEDVSSLHEALWWESLPNGKAHCYLCPRHCHIGEGQTGFCFIRKNIAGVLYNLGYAQPAALQIDPIEKKPLNHFMPGSRILSIGTAGCNMGCFFCQNWDISKSKADQINSIRLTPSDAARAAIDNGCPAIAFTYNEPTIWGEYVIDIAKEAHRAGLKTVMVTNGYVTRAALFDIYEHIDAANVDLKAFTERFYAKTTLTHLDPVLETLKTLRHETGVWFEITNLMIPDLNDGAEETKELCAWVLENLGDDVPLHFTAFHPDFKLRDRPGTPPETLHRARRIAMESGLKFVYEGNIYSDGGNTVCPGCKRTVLKRWWHKVSDRRISEEGSCEFCGERIAGYFSRPVNPRLHVAG
ncbi:MAG: AmmeMemoRadiSam system radical SAM enzyme [Acidobacteriota bacterium]|nr:AmmeMemoRadiSam system radical SAM enzyme [Acidobacteriota bacterium]